ncbi:GNAT family N-acetyltransferase [Bacillus sp. FJAT-29814]|uniref:GNAT family N-acetyltransferase n=1 Tax=Bacillus sp. FJAT-29814 TaxID=1729688 RepID=UPI00082CBD45|nr:GNAT family N-acetyltransferase [Bacillus sp. FJAT-29814]
MVYKQVEKLTSSQLNDLVRLFQMEWWTKGRELKEVEAMVEHSDIIVGLIAPDTEELIGFARVLSDFVYKAFIFDVVVSERYRGQMLGRQLLDAIIHHPRLQGVKHFELYCRPEMLPFYQKWGFSDELGALHFMRRVNSK